MTLSVHYMLTQQLFTSLPINLTARKKRINQRKDPDQPIVEHSTILRPQEKLLKVSDFRETKQCLKDTTQ